MNITHHKNGEIKTLVEEAPYHPGYEDAGFKPNLVKELTDEEIDKLLHEEFVKFQATGLISEIEWERWLVKAILRKDGA